MNTRPRNEITRLRMRRAAGEPLAPDESARLKAYESRYNRRKKSIHLHGTRAEEWEALARGQGLSVSAWMQERVIDSLHGYDDAVRDLRKENEKLRDEVIGLRGSSGQFAVENSKLQGRIEKLEASLREAMEHTLRLQMERGLR